MSRGLGAVGALLMLFLLAGCGGGGAGGGLVPASSVPPASGNLTIRSSALAGVSEIVVRGRDARGALVYGPVSQLPLPELRLTVPGAVVEIQLEYRGAGFFVAPVNLAGGATDLVTDARPQRVVRLQVEPATARHPVNVTLPARALAFLADGTATDVTASVAWTAGTTHVAVDAQGNVQGRQAGATTLGARLGDGAQASAALTVVEATPVALRLEPPARSVPVGLPVSFRAVALLSDGTSLPVQTLWQTAAPGTATVRATLGELTAEATLTGTEATLTGLGLLADRHLPAGAVQQARALGYFSDGTAHDLTDLVLWQSATPAVATVSGAGVLSARAAGEAQVQASLAGAEGSSDVTVRSVTLQSLRVEPPTLDLPLGVSRQFRAVGVYSDGTLRDVTNQATWSSGNTAAVTVGTEGLARAQAAGSAVLQAQVGSVTAQAPVQATSATLASLSVSPADALLAPGHGTLLQAWGRFSDGSVHEVTRETSWTSSAPAVATVGSDGAVAALAVGSTQVGASALGRTANGNVTVSGARLVALHLGPRALRTPVGTRLQLRAVAEYLDGAYRDITDSVDWTSDDPGKVVVTPGGLATAVAAGNATLTATDPATGAAVSGAFEAAAVSLVRLDVTPQSPTGWPEQEFGAFAVGEFTDGTKVDLTGQAVWSLTDPAVAVLEGSRVLCLAAGSATVQASVPDLAANGSTSLQVGAAPPEMQALTLDSLHTSFARPSDDGAVVALYATDNSGTRFTTGVHERLTGVTTRLFPGSDWPVWVRNLSADGRYVLLMSESAGLLPGDTDTRPDVFVHDRLLGTTQRVSVGSQGEETSRYCDAGGISEDGRFVTFLAEGGLFPGDTNLATDVYLHDRETGLTRWVSRGWDGRVSDGYGSSYPPSISGDGRYVAYESNSTNLVAGDTNGVADVFVFDRHAGRNRLVSRTSTGGLADRRATVPILSGDGSAVGWQSSATNLVPGVTGDHVYVADLRTGTLRVGSSTSAGVPADQASQIGSLSRDGRLLAFTSPATNLLPGKNTVLWEAYVKDLATGDLRWGNPTLARTRPLAATTYPLLAAGGSLLVFSSQASGFVAGDAAGSSRAFLYELRYPARTPQANPRAPERVNVSTDGTLSNAAVEATGFSVSGDGNLVAFSSTSTNLVAGDTNGVGDVFLRDLAAGTLVRPLAVQPDAANDAPVLTPDGRYLLFRSSATNLAGTTAGRSHLYLLDRTGGTLELVTRTDAGVEADNGSDSGTLSADGRYVAFRTSATNLAAGGAGLVVRDRQAATFTRLNLPTTNAYRPRIAGGGGTLVFTSNDATIVPGDTGGYQDCFAYDLGTGGVERVSVSTTGAQANSSSSDPDVSADGRYVVFGSTATNLVPGDTNAFQDVFVRDRLNDTTVRVNLGESGNQGNNNAQSWTISGDGRFAAFATSASNVLYGGFTGLGVVELATGLVRDGGRNGETYMGSGGMGTPRLTPDGRYVVGRTRNAMAPGRPLPNTLDDLYRALSPFFGGL